MDQYLKVVGLDPSFRNLGIAIGYMNTQDGSLTIKELHTIKTEPKPKKSKLSTSSWDITQARLLYDALQLYTSDADVVCVEVPYGSQDVKAAVGRGICLGVLSTIPCKNVINITPQSSKKILGNKSATKADSVAWASNLHPEAPWSKSRGRITIGPNEHVADAILAIYSAANQQDFTQYI